ncbi:hypothetical protein [Paraburkholderia strydomiana]|nr:hypothetical protein [Paraburkholderia strydomiana]MDR7006172.1 hypothetical protein [Paraburkholderia strydomiana]
MHEGLCRLAADIFPGAAVDALARAISNESATTSLTARVTLIASAKGRP